MQLLCNESVKENVIVALNIVPENIKKVFLNGLDIINCCNNQFYARFESNKQKSCFLLLDLSEKDILELDKFQSSISFYKQCVKIINNTVVSVDNSNIYVYKKRVDSTTIGDISLDDIARYKSKNLDNNFCDIYLLIPGQILDYTKLKNSITTESELFEMFSSQISAQIEVEYDSEFLKNMDRECIGEIYLQINDLTDNESYVQKALAGIVVHKSMFCILEIIVQNCCIGGNKLLSYYCGNMIRIKYNDCIFSIDDFCNFLGVIRYGKKRSVVFSNWTISDEEIVNALANEEYPMGKISGDLEKKLKFENIAQYDTAEVFASHETMFEKCTNINVFSDERLTYNTIELFFVEMVLLQDAAIEKIYTELLLESERQFDGILVANATERCEKLSFDMMQALRFGDYEQFSFPTVRESAKKLAICFGIEHIYDKYETNKTLIETMIHSNERQFEEKQNKIKNSFLFLISSLATIEAVGGLINTVSKEGVNNTLGYLYAVVFIIILYIFYKTTTFLIKIYTKQKVQKVKKYSTKTSLRNNTITKK